MTFLIFNYIIIIIKIKILYKNFIILFNLKVFLKKFNLRLK